MWHGRILPGLLALAAAFPAPAPASAQQMAQLQCQGMLYGAPAALAGVRHYAPYNRLGDGTVSFTGQVQAAGMQGQLVYQGYTQTGAFQGTLSGPLGVARIAVLDNTGGRFIIYDGTPSLGAPRTIGEFACAWR